MQLIVVALSTIARATYHRCALQFKKKKRRSLWEKQLNAIKNFKDELRSFEEEANFAEMPRADTKKPYCFQKGRMSKKFNKHGRNASSFDYSAFLH